MLFTLLIPPNFAAKPPLIFGTLCMGDNIRNKAMFKMKIAKIAQKLMVVATYEAEVNASGNFSASNLPRVNFRLKFASNLPRVKFSPRICLNFASVVWVFASLCWLMVCFLQQHAIVI